MTEPSRYGNWTRVHARSRTMPALNTPLSSRPRPRSSPAMLWEPSGSSTCLRQANDRATLHRRRPPGREACEAKPSTRDGDNGAGIFAMTPEEIAETRASAGRRSDHVGRQREAAKILERDRSANDAAIEARHRPHHSAAQRRE